MRLSSPKISVVTVCYDAAETIRETIDSFKKQTYENTEHIIIDGQSNDGTQDIIERHMDSIDKYISEKDQGIFDAMNKGIALAEGDLIGFLNADDRYLHKNFLKIVANSITNNPEAQYYSSRVLSVPTNEVSFEFGGPPTVQSNLYGEKTPHPSLYCSSEIFDSIGDFNISYEVASDYEWILRLITSDFGDNFIYDPQARIEFNLEGFSGDRWLKAQLEDFIIRVKYFPEKTHWILLRFVNRITKNLGKRALRSLNLHSLIERYRHS